MIDSPKSSCSSDAKKYFFQEQLDAMQRAHKNVAADRFQKEG